eukprot:UN03291
MPCISTICESKTSQHMKDNSDFLFKKHIFSRRELNIFAHWQEHQLKILIVFHPKTEKGKLVVKAKN